MQSNWDLDDLLDKNNVRFPAVSEGRSGINCEQWSLIWPIGVWLVNGQRAVLSDDTPCGEAPFQACRSSSSWSGIKRLSFTSGAESVLARDQAIA
jgi:hypothetical protein